MSSAQPRSNGVSNVVTSSTTKRTSLACKPESDIAYVGKKFSSRYQQFVKHNRADVRSQGRGKNSDRLTDYLDNAIGTKGCPSIREYNAGFKDVANFLEKIFGSTKYSTEIPLYTVYRVKPNRYQDNNVIYRADPCHHVGFKERGDWALFKTKMGLRVGQILVFVRMNQEMIDEYNKSVGVVDDPDLGLLDNDPGDYALVQLLSKEIPGLVDPSFHKHSHANVMQANSTLLFYGKKQIGSNKRPVTRLLPLYKIERPMVVFPDVHPEFSSSASGCKILNMNINEKRKHSFTVLRPRDLWHKVFIAEAIRHHSTLVGGEEAYIEREMKISYEEADEEEKVRMAKNEEKKIARKKAKEKKEADIKAQATAERSECIPTTGNPAVSKSGKKKRG